MYKKSHHESTWYPWIIPAVFYGTLWLMLEKIFWAAKRIGWIFVAIDECGHDDLDWPGQGYYGFAIVLGAVGAIIAVLFSFAVIIDTTIFDSIGYTATILGLVLYSASGIALNWTLKRNHMGNLFS